MTPLCGTLASIQLLYAHIDVQISHIAYES